MTNETITVFICGSALRGQPDNQHLSGAEFIGAANTAPNYRLHAVKDGWHPGIYVDQEQGISIPGELYAMTPKQYAYLKNNEPPHMYPETITLDNGLEGITEATAFLYPKELIDENNWPDISHHGGWANYKASNT